MSLEYAMKAITITVVVNLLIWKELMIYKIYIRIWQINLLVQSIFIKKTSKQASKH